MDIMSKFIDLIGKKFGRLTVIIRAKNDNENRAYWLCECNCGEKKIISGSSLRGGVTRSCGCLSVEKTIKRSTKHGHRKTNKTTQAYTAWRNMKNRCGDPGNKHYRNYGGRGIKVCKSWMKFENFLEDMGESSEGYEIDRIDNNEGYYKKNCHWTTRSQQQRNKRNNHIIPFNGKTQCLIIWAEETGINESTIRYRLNCGWSIKKALTTPVRGQKR